MGGMSGFLYVVPANEKQKIEKRVDGFRMSNKKPIFALYIQYRGIRVHITINLVHEYYTE